MTHRRSDEFAFCTLFLISTSVTPSIVAGIYTLLNIYTFGIAISGPYDSLRRAGDGHMGSWEKGKN